MSLRFNEEMGKFLAATEIATARQEGAAMAARACRTCAHREFTRCGATGFYLTTERGSPGPCGHLGKLWQPRPRYQPGVFAKAWRFLFGWRP